MGNNWEAKRKELKKLSERTLTGTELDKSLATCFDALQEGTPLNVRFAVSAFAMSQITSEAPRVVDLVEAAWNPECLEHGLHVNIVPKMAELVIHEKKRQSDNALKAVLRMANVVFALTDVQQGDAFCQEFIAHLATGGEKQVPKLLRTITKMVHMLEDPQYPSAFSMIVAAVRQCSTSHTEPARTLVQSAQVLGEVAKHLDMGQPYLDAWEEPLVARVTMGHARAYVQKKWCIAVDTVSTQSGDFDVYAEEQRKFVQCLARMASLRVIGLFRSKQAVVREAAVRYWPPTYPLSESAQGLSDPSPKVRSAMIRVLEQWYSTRKAPKIIVESIANLANDQCADVRRSVAKFMISLPQLPWDCAVQVSLLLEDEGADGIGDSARQGLVAALFRVPVVGGLNFFVLRHPNQHVLNMLFSEWGDDCKTWIANAFAREYVSSENESYLQALQIMLHKGVTVDMTYLTAFLDVLFTCDEFAMVNIASVLTTALTNGQELVGVNVGEVEAKLWRIILMGNNWAVTRAYAHLLHAMKRSAPCVTSIKRLLTSQATEDANQLQLNLCYALSCFLEVGAKDDVGTAYGTFMTQQYAKAPLETKDDALWIFVPLLRGLSAKEEESPDFARDSEAIYLSFLQDILKPALVDDAQRSSIAVLAILAQNAKEQGDVMKLESLTDFCDLGHSKFESDPFQVIAFLGTLYESGLLFPAALEFRSLLVAAVIGNVDGAEVALALLKTMDAHQVAAGFLSAKEIVQENRFLPDGVAHERAIERIASLLEVFNNKHKNVVLKTVLKAVELAYVRRNETTGYLQTLAMAVSRMPQCAVVTDWCAVVVGKAPKSKQDQVTHAVSYWLGAHKVETMSFDEVVETALARKKRDLQDWLAEVRDDIGEIATTRTKKRRRSETMDEDKENVP